MFIYIVCPNKKEAKKIGRFLVQKRLAGCVNIFPIESIYRWQGKIVESEETVLLVKTLKNNFKKTETEVKKMHIYKVPCIVELPAGRMNSQYLDWLRDSIK